MQETVTQPLKTRAFYLKRGLGLLLLLALSATFLYSAYTKSGIRFDGFKLVSNENAFDSFQWSFIDLGVTSAVVAGVLARLMIGLELLLGLFLLFHIYLRQLTYKAVIGILAVFIIYLVMLIGKQGDTGNCGCFGEHIAMKPSAAIIKNVIMIAATVLLYFIYPVRPYKNQEYVALLAGLVSFTTPYLVNNLFVGSEPEVVKHAINLDPLYQFDGKPTVDLRKGKHIIAFMSYTCPHCKKAAYLMQIIHRQHPEIPLYLVLDGADEYRQKFFSETHAEGIPNLAYRHTPEFEAMINAGLSEGEQAGVPAIYWVNNGVIEYKSRYAYYQLDPKYMLSWLRKP